MEFITTTWLWIGEQHPIFFIFITMIWTSALGLLLRAADSRKGS